MWPDRIDHAFIHGQSLHHAINLQQEHPEAQKSTFMIALHFLNS